MPDEGISEILTHDDHFAQDGFITLLGRLTKDSARLTSPPDPLIRLSPHPNTSIMSFITIPHPCNVEPSGSDPALADKLAVPGSRGTIMSDHFSELSSPRDMLDKAKREAGLMKADLNIDNIFNFFVTAYHIQDYIQTLADPPRAVYA